MKNQICFDQKLGAIGYAFRPPLDSQLACIADASFPFPGGRSSKQAITQTGASGVRKMGRGGEGVGKKRGAPYFSH